MRIIAGKLKGRVLRVPKSAELRPTSDRVKESIFSVIESRISLDGLRVLDLYAGSGALGIEALSRGAGFALFIERVPRIADSIKANLSLLGKDEDGVVITGDVKRVLEDGIPDYCGLGQFDVVFSDPPYRDTTSKELLCLLLQGDILREGSVVVIESGSHSDETIIDRVERLCQFSEKKYGETRVRFYIYE